MMNKKIRKIEKSAFELEYVGVKAPQFSFSRLKGSDPTLSVEMASTGEVACFGDDIYEAFLKSFLSVGYKIPQRAILISSGTPEDKAELLHSCRTLKKLNYLLYATQGTHDYLEKNNIPSYLLNWPDSPKDPKVLEYIKKRKLDLIINIPKTYQQKELTNDYKIRRAAIDYNIPLITNTKLAELFIHAISLYKEKDLLVKAWSKYGEGDD